MPRLVACAALFSISSKPVNSAGLILRVATIQQGRTGLNAGTNTDDYRSAGRRYGGHVTLGQSPALRILWADSHIGIGHALANWLGPGA